jgi:hypothetical protein
MKPFIVISLALAIPLFFSCSGSNDNPVNDDLEGPISRPESGYGSDGSYNVAENDFQSPMYTGKYVSVFYPQGITTPRPVIFYSHAYGGEDKDYCIGLFNFIAKKGYVVVFAPYPTTGVSVDDRYNILWSSFTAAVKKYPGIIDTTKVGFMGHSFGGGASFALSYKGFVGRGWGEKGRFIFAMAQWYAFQITQEQLQSFPSNVRLLTEVYDDDVTNDHRLAIDIFKNINIANSEKDFILIKKSEVPGYTYTAEHNLPNTRSAYDAYDYYGVYRLLDALADYSFNGSSAGKEVALGNGSLKQVTMPSYNGTALEPLVETDDPSPLYPQSKYEFQCSSVVNPRITYCN